MNWRNSLLWVLLMFRSDINQVLVGIFDHFQCLWMLWHSNIWTCQNFDQKSKALNFLWPISWKTAIFWGQEWPASVSCWFFYSAESFLTTKNGSFSQNWPFFTKLSIKKFKSLLFWSKFWHVQILWVSEHPQTLKVVKNSSSPP